MKWITVSRKTGTRGSELARQVASQLGYQLYDTKAINRMAQELGVLGSVREVDEHVPPLLQRLFSQRPMVDLERLYSVIYELARRGDAVFLGRGSHVLLRDFPCALHVRVTASPETCIRTLMAQGLSRDAAARAVQRGDDERAGFVRFAFGVDWENSARYDLVLNVDKIPLDLAVSTVVHMARSPQIADASPADLAALEGRALESRAEAALVAANPGGSYAPTLSVSVVRAGTIRVCGQVDTAAQRVEAEQVLRAVKGVLRVENEIQVVPVHSGI
jgi:cytidylate kinase